MQSKEIKMQTQMKRETFSMWPKELFCEYFAKTDNEKSAQNSSLNRFNNFQMKRKNLKCSINCYIYAILLLSLPP